MEGHEQRKDEGDVSNKTVFVLVLLTLAVSFVGAWVSVASVTELPAQQGPAASGAAGQITFGINAPGRDEGSAGVAFEIVETDETG